MEQFINRIIAKYDDLIAELEAINEENRSFVEEANKNPDSEEIREWAKLARENLRRLKFAKAERDYLEEKYKK